MRATGSFRGDFEQGRWTFGEPSGQLSRTGDFVDARQVGWWRYFEDGELSAEGLISDGLRVGPWRERPASHPLRS